MPTGLRRPKAGCEALLDMVTGTFQLFHDAQIRHNTGHHGIIKKDSIFKGLSEGSIGFTIPYAVKGVVIQVTHDDPRRPDGFPVYPTGIGPL